MTVEFTKVTSKGQVVIPASLRRKLRMKTGTRIAVHEDHGQLILQPVTEEYIKSLCGMLGDTSDIIEQMLRDHEQEDK